MNLRSKHILAARVLKAGLDRVWFDPEKATEIKEAVTKDDIRKLITMGVILVKQKQGVSRGRFRRALKQRRKGRGIGPAKKQGAKGARLNPKGAWINKIRSQRTLFSELLEKKLIMGETYKHLRGKAKGGFFRSKRHIMLYLTERNLWNNKK